MPQVEDEAEPRLKKEKKPAAKKNAGSGSKRSFKIKPAHIWAALCVCLVVAIALISKTGVFQSGGEVKNGTIDFSDSDSRITSVPKGEALFNMNTVVTFENSRSLGNIMIENPEASEFTIVVKIYYYHDSVSNVIYESDKIAPGQYIVGDRLDYKLEKGTYQCYYNAEAYKDGVFKGKTEAQPMTVTVEK